MFYLIKKCQTQLKLYFSYIYLKSYFTTTVVQKRGVCYFRESPRQNKRGLEPVRQLVVLHEDLRPRRSVADQDLWQPQASVWGDSLQGRRQAVRYLQPAGKTVVFKIIFLHIKVFFNNPKTQKNQKLSYLLYYIRIVSLQQRRLENSSVLHSIRNLTGDLTTNGCHSPNSLLLVGRTLF